MKAGSIPRRVKRGVAKIRFVDAIRRDPRPRPKEGRIIIKRQRGKLVTEQPTHYCEANKLLDEATKKNLAAMVLMRQEDGCVTIAGHRSNPRIQLDLLQRASNFVLNELMDEGRALAKDLKKLNRAKRKSLR